MKRLLTTSWLGLIVSLISVIAWAPSSLAATTDLYDREYYSDDTGNNVWFSANGRLLITQPYISGVCQDEQSERSEYNLYALRKHRTSFAQTQYTDTIPLFRVQANNETRTVGLPPDCDASYPQLINFYNDAVTSTDVLDSVSALHGFQVRLGTDSGHPGQPAVHVAPDHSWFSNSSYLTSNFDTRQPEQTSLLEDFQNKFDNDKLIFPEGKTYDNYVPVGIMAVSPDSATVIYSIDLRNSNNNHRDRSFWIISNLPASPQTWLAPLAIFSGTEDDYQVQFGPKDKKVYIKENRDTLLYTLDTSTRTSSKQELTFPEGMDDSTANIVLSPNKQNAYLAGDDMISYVPDFAGGSRIITQSIPLDNVYELYPFSDGRGLLARTSDAKLYYIENIKQGSQAQRITNLDIEKLEKADPVIIPNPKNHNFYVFVHDTYGKNGFYAFHKN